MGVQGDVILRAVIDRDGNVTDLSVVRSIPFLDQSAIAAARKWKYEPTLAEGVAVPIELELTVQFRLTP